MQICHFPIPIDRKTCKLSKYTATIYQDKTLRKLIKIFGEDVVNKYWPKDLRAKPELLDVLELQRWKKIYIDRSPITHQQKYGSTYAMDFLVPIGTQITPILDGKVCDIKSGIDEYGMDFKYANECNSVCIDHGFNTFSEYMHVDPSYKIQMDMRVTSDDIIGSVCASGMEDLPHTHVNYFQFIERNNGREKESIPMESLEFHGKDLWKM